MVMLIKAVFAVIPLHFMDLILSFTVVPKIVFTEDYIVNQFEEVTFECRATGIPASYINWYRNGVLLNEAFDSRISSVTPL